MKLVDMVIPVLLGVGVFSVVGGFIHHIIAMIVLSVLLLTLVSLLCLRKLRDSKKERS